MTRSRWIIVGVVIVALVLMGAGYAMQSRKPMPGVKPGVTSDQRAPDGQRVRVQVLNSTKTHGLARRATFVLRDRGFDVVETGTISTEHDTTLIYDLSGHPEWATRVARAFAPARVMTRSDSSRYLDIAVVLGSTWRPPSEPFYP
jgi:hypothetical protein